MAKISREQTELDYVIPGYSLHTVNFDSNVGWGIIIYIYSSIDNCVIQINLASSLVKYVYSKFDYVEEIIYSLVVFTEAWLLTTTSEKNNANLNNLL